MPLETELLRLPHPEHPDPADVPVDLEALVNRLEALAPGLFFMPGDLKVTAALHPQEGWLLCDGRSVLRSQFGALFDAIGTAYGQGEQPGQTFALPDFRGRVPLGAGEGPGMTRRIPGQLTGSEAHRHNVPPLTLQATVLPHRHGLTAGRIANHQHGVGGVRVNVPPLRSRHSHAHGSNSWAWISAWTRPGGEQHIAITMKPHEGWGGPPSNVFRPANFEHVYYPPRLQVNPRAGGDWPSFRQNPQGRGGGLPTLGGRTNEETAMTESASAGLVGTTDAASAALTGTTDDGPAAVSGQALGAVTSDPVTAGGTPVDSTPPACVVNVFIKT